MKKIAFLALFIIIVSCVKHENQNKEMIDIRKDIVVPKNYVISKAKESITINGVADESSWQQAKFTDSFIDIEGIKTPKYDTKVKMLWDEKFIYVYAELIEPHIWADIKERDAIIYFNNDFEVFIDPSGTGINYGEIEMNALNTVWDLLLTKPYRVGGKAIFEWNLSELKTAVQVNGSLNDAQDIDSYWSLEMAIPLDALLELRGKPRVLPLEGEQWRINFSRVEWEFELTDGKYNRKKENDKFLPENNWVWSPQKVINMHEPEKWGYLQFTYQHSSKEINFKADPDLIIKQVAFALFRNTQFGSLNELVHNKPGYSRELKVRYDDANFIYAGFYKTNSGFEYRIISPITMNIIIINEVGFLKIIHADSD